MLATVTTDVTDICVETTFSAVSVPKPQTTAQGDTDPLKFKYHFVFRFGFLCTN